MERQASGQKDGVSLILFVTTKITSNKVLPKKFPFVEPVKWLEEGREAEGRRKAKE